MRIQLRCFGVVVALALLGCGVPPEEGEPASVESAPQALAPQETESLSPDPTTADFACHDCIADCCNTLPHSIGAHSNCENAARWHCADAHAGRLCGARCG